MFERLGHTIYRARWTVIAIWALILIVSLPFTLQLLLPQGSSVLKGGGFANGTAESDRATDLLTHDLGFFPSSVDVIFSSDTLRATDPRFQRAMQAALVPAHGLPSVARIDTSYDHALAQNGTRFISDGGRYALAILEYRVDFDHAQTLVTKVRQTIHSPTLHVLVAGDAAVFWDVQEVSKRDLQKVETYTFPVALLLLLLIFGTLVASSVPIITGAVSVVATLAIMYGLGHVADLSIFALNVTTMIGLGVGIDYALFVVSRFREEVRVHSVEDAVVISMSSAGRAVLFSGITVICGLAGLLIFHSMALRSIGVGGALVVLISVITALTLLPALLSVIGTRIDALPVVPWRHSGTSPFWHALATRVMRRPWPVIVATLAIVAVIALPFREIHLDVPGATILPQSVDSRKGFDILNDSFHQQQDNPVIVIVQAPGGVLAPARMAALYDYVHILARDPGVKPDGVGSLVTFSPIAGRDAYVHLARYSADPAVILASSLYLGKSSTLISLQPRPGQSEPQLETLVKRVRAVPIGAGMARYVGGYNAGVLDYINNLYAQFPITVLFVVLVTYLVLLVLLRSVILPLKAVLMNVLSLLGAYGAAVWIFQQGHLSGLLNFSPTGHIDEITPIIMFCTLFGLSMDYEVFLLSRVREQYLRTGDNASSVALGLERTGRIITSAALILVVVAASFAFTDIVLVKAIGLGLAIAILLDATLIRCLLVPATMRVLGNWNWWLPRWLHPLLGDNTPDTRQEPEARHVA